MLIIRGGINSKKRELCPTALALSAFYYNKNKHADTYIMYLHAYSTSSLGKNRMVLLSTHIVSDIDYIADRILIMKNGELIQEGTEKEITDKVEGCVWKCIVSEKEAGQITSSFIVSNMRSSGENVELRIVSERQPVAGAENVESTLEDAYLYHTQITGGEKNATL